MTGYRPPTIRLNAVQNAPLPIGDPNLPSRCDAVVVGAGVIGLSIAWRIARAGGRVVLFDAAETGGGTSGAGTGMLAATAELEPGGQALLALALASQALWPDFRDALEGDAGMAIDYRREGTLVVANSRDEVDRLKARQAFQQSLGLHTRWLTASALRELEPALRPGVAGGLLCPADHQVDPHAMLRALRRAAEQRGVHLAEGTPVEALTREAGRVTGVIAAGRACRAPLTILATGPAPLPPGWLPEMVWPVRPLKGQALALRLRAGPSPLRHVLWTSDIHLAPKSDGRIILGATVEEAGFDPSVTAGGVYALLEAARRVLPATEEMAVDGLWSGFRPTTPDDAPVLGPSPAPGLALAVGHHRNGYLLAPVTAAALSALACGESGPEAADGFGWERFASLLNAERKRA